MQTMTIREFAHHLADNLKRVKAGERLVILDRKTPIADIIPHQEHVTFPGWKRKITRISSKTAKLTQAILENRESDR